jgi:excisionase family DNA binding protein
MGFLAYISPNSYRTPGMPREQSSQQSREWITATEAGRLLGLTSRRVRQLLEEGELEGEQINPRLWLVKRQSVEEYRKRKG